MKSKGKGLIPNKAMLSRVSYLFQAATYLTTLQQPHANLDAEPLKHRSSNDEIDNVTDSEDSEQGLSESRAQLQIVSRHLISDLRAVSLKAQIRISPTLKHTICKNCDTLLFNGSTCTNEVENKSKGGKKPWSDILVRKCNTCGLARRYPVGAERQKKRPQRSNHNIEEVRESDW